MNWKVVGILGLIIGLIGIGGYAYGADQHQKRRNEKDSFSEEIRKKEEQLADLEARFGRQSEQFKVMAEELRRYKQQKGFNGFGCV